MNRGRYGLIGAGMMGQEHIRNLQLLEGAQVVAICDPDTTMRNRARDLIDGDCKTHVAHRDLLDGAPLDALVIASPNHTHRDILNDAVPKGLPILVEKPLCTKVADCDGIITLARQFQTPVWVAMEYRYMAPVQALLEAVDQRVAGIPKMITIREHRYPFLTKVGHWNRFSTHTGGTLIEKCCHFFDLFRLIAQAEAVRVYASGAMDVNHVDERYGPSYPRTTPDIIDNAFVTVDFANGIRAMLELCMFAEGSHWQERIGVIGDEASVAARIPAPPRFSPNAAHPVGELVVASRADGVPVKKTIPIDPMLSAAGDHHGATFYQHQRFLNVVLHGSTPDVSLEDGKRAVEIGAAAEHSAASGEVVVL